MKDAHVSLRLPLDLARRLARRARALGVPRSQLVREAVSSYLLPEPAPAEAMRTLSASELAARWRMIPRLTSAEAADMAADVEASRAELPAMAAPWE